MSDVSRRDFMKKAGITGAVLLTYVAPTVETFKIADAWADEEGSLEGHEDEGRRHPSRKKKGWPGQGGEGTLQMETTE